MMIGTKWIATAALAAMLGAGVAMAQDGGDAADGARRGGRDGRGRAALRGRHGRGEGLAKHRGAFARHRRARIDLMRSMAFTADQQRTMLEQARAAQPAAAESRKELARLLVDLRAKHEAAAAAGGTADPAAAKEARKAARAAAREQFREMKRRSGERLAPMARQVIASFTPEQRAKLEGFAAAHGRKLDEEKLVRRVGRMLARPMTADLLEAKLGTR